MAGSFGAQSGYATWAGGQALPPTCASVAVPLQRLGRRRLAVTAMKKDIHPKFFEEAKVCAPWGKKRPYKLQC